VHYKQLGTANADLRKKQQISQRNMLRYCSHYV